MEAAGPYELVSVDSGYQRVDRSCLGIVLVARRERSTGGNQFALAFVRDLESTAGNSGAVRGHDHHRQDGQSSFCARDFASAYVAGCGDIYGVVAKDVRPEPAHWI